MSVDHQTAIDRALPECYSLGELDEVAAAEFEGHLFDCPACAREVRELAEFIANVKSILSEGYSD